MLTSYTKLYEVSIVFSFDPFGQQYLLCVKIPGLAGAMEAMLYTQL